MKKITVTNIDISISVRPDNNDYICLTDMAHFKDRERTNYIIQNWMRLRSTIDFLGLWEKLNNPNFKGIEFDAFKMESGTNSFTLTPKQWIEKTKAIGIISKPGRYGGTFAHKDIAFEFGTWLSPDSYVSCNGYATADGLLLFKPCKKALQPVVFKLA